jgi:hypothetical protein
VLSIVEGTVLGENDGNELKSVVGDVKGFVLGRNDLIELGFILGDVEGSVLRGDDSGTSTGALDRVCRGRGRRPRTVTVEIPVGTEVGNIFLRRRRRTVTVEIPVGTEVGNIFLLRRRATTMLVRVGAEVGDTGRGLGLLVGFLIGGNVGFLTGGGGYVGFSFSREYGDTIFELFPCFPAFPFFFWELKFLWRFLFSRTDLFGLLRIFPRLALLVSPLKMLLALTASSSISLSFSLIVSER